MEYVKMKRPVIGMTGVPTAVRVHTVYPHPQAYCQAVHDHGGLPLTLPAFLTVEESLRYLEHVDAMIFIGGPDIPPRFFGEKPIEGDHAMLREDIAEAHLALVKAVLASDIPFLGVCLGCQELCVGSGGKLIQHLDDLTVRHRNSYIDTEKEHRPDTYHFVETEENSLIRELFGKKYLRVNSCHHQAVNPAFECKNFKITARSIADGVVESMECQDREFGLGVQWHPERIDDLDHRKRIFDALISAAIRHRS